MAEGQAALWRGDTDTADKVAHRLIALRPDSPESHVFLAAVRNRLGDFPGVIEAATMALQLCPDHNQALYARGCAHLMLGEEELGLQDIEAILTKHPCDWSAVAQRAAILGRRGATNEEIKALARLRQLTNDCHYALLAMVEAYRATGMAKEAAELCDKAIAKRPSVSGARRVRGLMRMQDGDYEGATEDLKEVLRVSPASGGLHFLLAGCLRLQSKYREALQHAEKARELGWRLDDKWLEAIRKSAAEEQGGGGE